MVFFSVYFLVSGIFQKSDPGSDQRPYRISAASRSPFPSSTRTSRQPLSLPR
jgi:hypothetical protein